MWEINAEKTTHGQLRLVDVPIPSSYFGKFVSSWLIQDAARDQVFLVETGPAVSTPYLLENLKAMGVTKIDYVICTHIHLDHTGGLGHFIQAYPNAKIIAPSKGRPHLESPERLWEGSLKVLGDVAELYTKPLPIATDAFLDLGCLPAGLTRCPTPGHAPHHDSYLYELGGLKILFNGDAGGVCFPIEGEEPYQRPTTPPRFYYEEARVSLRAAEKLNADILCFPHYGAFDHVSDLLQRSLDQIDRWWEWVAEGKAKGLSKEEIVTFLLARDPYLRNIEKLPEGEPQRERHFMMQSIAGFLSAQE